MQTVEWPTRPVAAAALVAATGLACLAVPVAAGGAVTTLVTLVGAGALATLAASRRVLPPRATWPLLGLISAATAWMLLAAALSTTPRVSLVGWVGQHDGALLWVCCLLVLGVSAAIADARGLRWLTITCAVLGAVMAVGAGLDALGALGRAGRYSIEPSGFLESSASLGQLLLLALACSLAWLLFARSTGGRVGAIACALAAGGGLALAQSRAAWVGLVLGAAVAAAVHRAGARARRGVVLALVAIALLSVALLPGILAGKLGPGPAEMADRLSNGRAGIWRSALEAARTSLVTGRGPDQFSAWVSWDVPRVGDLRASGAYDPHDLMLYLLVSGGVPGLLLGVAALAAVLDGLLAGSAGARGGPGPTLIAGGLVAWAIALRFAWINPLTAVVAAALAGTSLGLLRRDAEPVAPAWREGVGPAVATAVGLFCLAAALPLVPAVVTEVRWARSAWVARSDATALEAAYASHPDPIYAAGALEVRIARGTQADLESGKRLAEALARPAARHVDAALAAVGLWEAYGAGTGQNVDAEVYSAVDTGRRADPASGLWDYAGTLWASQRGDTARAHAFAEDALTRFQPPAAQTWLRSQVATTP